MTKDTYWQECIESAFQDAGIIATPEQIENVAAAVAVSHSNIGMAFHEPEHPVFAELTKARMELTKERSKIICPACKGRGVEISFGGTFQFTGVCDKCKGEGRVIP